MYVSNVSDYSIITNRQRSRYSTDDVNLRRVGSRVRDKNIVKSQAEYSDRVLVKWLKVNKWSTVKRKWFESQQCRGASVGLLPSSVISVGESDLCVFNDNDDNNGRVTKPVPEISRLLLVLAVFAYLNCLFWLLWLVTRAGVISEKWR